MQHIFYMEYMSVCEAPRMWWAFTTFSFTGPFKIPVEEMIQIEELLNINYDKYATWNVSLSGTFPDRHFELKLFEISNYHYVPF